MSSTPKLTRKAGGGQAYISVPAQSPESLEYGSPFQYAQSPTGQRTSAIPTVIVVVVFAPHFYHRWNAPTYPEAYNYDEASAHPPYMHPAMDPKQTGNPYYSHFVQNPDEMFTFHSLNDLLRQCRRFLNLSEATPTNMDVIPTHTQSLATSQPTLSNYEQFIKPYYQDMTEQQFNGLHQNCKDYLIKQQETSFILSGNDGDDFKQALEYKKKHGAIIIDMPHTNESTTVNTPALPVPSATKAPNHIFFIHFSQKLENVGYLCAIEAAARHHPNHAISVFVADQAGFKNEAYQTWFSRVPASFKSQIRIRTIDYQRIFYGTPLQQWYENGTYKNGNKDWIDQNLGNALRLAIMWSEGGIYLDLDVISLNNFDRIDRMLGREDDNKVNNAVLVFPERDPFIESAIKVFVDRWNGNLWQECRQDMKKLDFHNDPPFEYNTEPFTPADWCSTLVVANRRRVYPFLYNEKDKYLKNWSEHECGAIQAMSRESLGLHWWNKMIKFDAQNSALTFDSVIVKIMQKHCPAYMQPELGPKVMHLK